MYCDWMQFFVNFALTKSSSNASVKYGVYFRMLTHISFFQQKINRQTLIVNSSKKKKAYR